MLEKTERAFKNGQSIDTDNIACLPANCCFSNL